MFYFSVYSSANWYAVLHFNLFEVFEYCQQDSKCRQTDLKTLSYHMHTRTSSATCSLDWV